MECLISILSQWAYLHRHRLSWYRTWQHLLCILQNGQLGTLCYCGQNALYSPGRCWSHIGNNWWRHLETRKRERLVSGHSRNENLNQIRDSQNRWMKGWNILPTQVQSKRNFNAQPDGLWFKDHHQRSIWACTQPMSDVTMTLHCNIISHWLGSYTKWSMHQGATSGVLEDLPETGKKRQFMKYQFNIFTHYSLITQSLIMIIIC